MLCLQNARISEDENEDVSDDLRMLYNACMAIGLRLLPKTPEAFRMR